MSARGISIGILIGGLAISGLILAAVIPALQQQKSSDCTSSQIYDSSSKKCREMTASEKKKVEEVELDRKISRGQQNGSVCYSAKESWDHIGEYGCVAFYPEYFYRTGNGYLFIDEKKDYKNGFVAFFTQKNMLSWDTFLSKYSTGKTIAVSGLIVRYEGHPEIKVSSLSQITDPVFYGCTSAYGCVYSPGLQL